MRNSLSSKTTRKLILAALLIIPSAVFANDIATPSAGTLPDKMQLDEQMTQILEKKQSRSEADEKISSHILDMLDNTANRTTSQQQMNIQDGAILLDVHADISPRMLRKIVRLGGQVISSSERFAEMRIRLPMNAVQRLARDKTVHNIRPAEQGMTQMINTSAGREAHRVDSIINEFGVDGSEVTIGVLSDSVRFLQQSQQSGDLPANVTILPGQSGVAANDSGEGTAMLEIVHDLAPGADLMFATAFGGQASMAENIIALRNAGADIIVDDVFYFAESAFQDGMIAQAVNQVVDDGALYFSSAGNSGNLNDGTSGTWEGDYNSIARFGADVHDFGDSQGAAILTQASQSPITLRWNDPLGASANDYDLFVIQNGVVIDSSTNIQNGNDDPFEIVGPQPAGAQLIVVRRGNAANRVIHLSTNRGRLNIATDSQITGHAAALRGIAVAAVNAARANGGVFIGGVSNPVETFSSDGPRRVFYDENGNPLSQDLTAAGGIIRQVPQIAAADGVATSVPGFNPFFGTSAAAPHAAAIAGALLSARPDATGDQILNSLFATALDIEAPGFDRDSGNGVIDAAEALNILCQDEGCNFNNGSTTPIDEDNAFRNDQDIAIPDGIQGGIQGTIDVTRSGGIGAVTVSFDIVHTARGNLRITVFTPTGARAVLANTSNDRRDNLSRTITLNGGTLPTQGIWRLQIEDLITGNTGFLDTWSLTFE